MDENPRITELRKKLDKDPGSRLFAQLAEELRKEGKHDEAIAVAVAGLQKNPNYPSARLTLARALIDSGRPSEARPELEQIVRASPDNILAGRLLGDALEDLGEIAQAIQQFEATLRLSPGDKALTDKLHELRSKKSAPSPPARSAASVPGPVPDAARKSESQAVAPQASVPSVFEASPLPSIFEGEPATGGSAPNSLAAEASIPSVFPEAALPSIFDSPAPLQVEPPLPSLFPEAPLPSVLEPVAPAAPSLALDRDLASGTFSPGSLHVSDLSFLNPGVSEPESAPAPAPGLTVTEEPDEGAATLPLTTLTLADLYLQQGLKAEASAVLSQVLKEEPDNAGALSRLAAVSNERAESQPPTPVGPSSAAAPPAVPSPVPERAKTVEPIPAKVATPTAPRPRPPALTPPAPANASPPAAPARVVPAPLAAPAPVSPAPAQRAPRTRAERASRSIHSLKAFLSAVEREAIQQRATERGAF